MDIEEGEILLSDEEDQYSCLQGERIGGNELMDIPNYNRPRPMPIKTNRMKDKKRKDSYDLKVCNLGSQARKSRVGHLDQCRMKTKCCIQPTRKTNFKLGFPNNDNCFGTDQWSRDASSVPQHSHSSFDSSHKISKKRKKKRKSLKEDVFDNGKKLKFKEQTVNQSLFKKVVSNSGPHSRHTDKHHNTSLMNKLVISGFAKELQINNNLDSKILVSKSEEHHFIRNENMPFTPNAMISSIKEDSVSPVTQPMQCFEDNDSDIEVIIPIKKVPPLVTLDSDGEEVNTMCSNKSLPLECKETTTLELFPRISEKPEAFNSENKAILNSNHFIKEYIISSPSFSDNSSVKCLDSDKDTERYCPSSPSSCSNEEDCNGSCSNTSLTKETNVSISFSKLHNVTGENCIVNDVSCIVDNANNIERTDSEQSCIGIKFNCIRLQDSFETQGLGLKETVNGNTDNPSRLSKSAALSNLSLTMLCSEPSTPLNNDSLDKVDNVKVYNLPSDNESKQNEITIRTSIEKPNDDNTSLNLKDKLENINIGLKETKSTEMKYQGDSREKVANDVQHNKIEKENSNCEINSEVIKNTDEDLSQLRLLALSSKGKISLNAIEDLKKSNENIYQSNTSADDDEDEDILQFRVEALKSAVIKKHKERIKRGLAVKKKSLSGDLILNLNGREDIFKTNELWTEKAIDLPLDKGNINESLQGEEDMEIDSDCGGDIQDSSHLQLSEGADDVKTLSVESSIGSNSHTNVYSTMLHPFRQTMNTSCPQPFPSVLPPPPPIPTMIFPLLPPPPPPPLPSPLSPSLPSSLPPPVELNCEENKSCTYKTSDYDQTVVKMMSSNMPTSGKTVMEQSKTSINNNAVLVNTDGTKESVDTDIDLAKSTNQSSLVQLPKDQLYTGVSNGKNVSVSDHKSRTKLNPIPVLVNSSKKTLTKKKLRLMKKFKLKTKELCKKRPKLLQSNEDNICMSHLNKNMSVQSDSNLSVLCSTVESGMKKNVTHQTQGQNTFKHSSLLNSGEISNDHDYSLLDNKCLNKTGVQNSQFYDDGEMDLSNMIVLDEVGMSPEHNFRCDKYESSLAKDVKIAFKDQSSSLTTIPTKIFCTRPPQHLKATVSAPHKHSVLSKERLENSNILKTQLKIKTNELKPQKQSVKQFSNKRSECHNTSQYRLTRVQCNEPGRSVVQQKNSLKVMIPSESPPQSLPLYPSPPMVERLVIKVGQDSDSDDDCEWLRRVHFSSNDANLPREPDVDHELERKIDLLLMNARQTTENLKQTSKHSTDITKKSSNDGQFYREEQAFDFSDTPLWLLPREKQQEYYRLKKIIQEKERLKQNVSKTAMLENVVVQQAKSFETKKISKEQMKNPNKNSVFPASREQYSNNRNNKQKLKKSVLYSKPILKNREKNVLFGRFDLPQTVVKHDEKNSSTPEHILEKGCNQVKNTVDCSMKKDEAQLHQKLNLHGKQFRNNNHIKNNPNNQLHLVQLLNEQSRADDNHTDQMNKEAVVISCNDYESRKDVQEFSLEQVTENKGASEFLYTDSANSEAEKDKQRLDSQLTSYQAQLLNERFLVIEELSKVSECLGQLEREHVGVSSELSKISQLRRELLDAEHRLETRAANMQRVEQAVYEAHMAVYLRHRQIEHLTLACTRLGTQLQGLHYQAPTSGSELMLSKIRQVTEKNLKIRENKRKIKKVIIENAIVPIHSVNVEDEHADKTSSLLQEPELKHFTPLPVDLIIDRQSQDPTRFTAPQKWFSYNQTDSPNSNISRPEPQNTPNLRPYIVSNKTPTKYSLPNSFMSTEISKSSVSEVSENNQKLDNILQLEPLPTKSFQMDNKKQDYNEISMPTLTTEQPGNSLGKIAISELGVNSDQQFSTKKPNSYKTDNIDNNPNITRDDCVIGKRAISANNKSRLKYKSVLQLNRPSQSDSCVKAAGDIICRYELSGRCQDQQCKYKHL